MAQTRQTMTLDKEGFLLTSCDTLFSSESFVGKNMIERFPFLESVFSDLLEKLELGRTISFPRIETKHVFLAGYYDYVFRVIRIRNSGLGIQWEIIDATQEYSILKDEQQLSHENDIGY